MKISLETVQELAPDQASLKAAKKLLKPAKWPVLGQASSVHSIWGECQGSGANPYYTMANAVDYGYKCTCPSRKFPCKHVLALMWQYAQNSSKFIESDPPEWVNDWLGRRRKTRNTPATKKDKSKKNISFVDKESEQTVSPEEIVKKEAAKAKRAAKLKAKTETGINDGLYEFQQWVNDQLHTGIVVFVKEINKRCRQIAARLVDAKAINFASRIDELPAKILSLPLEQQPTAVLKEFGQLILLSEAWFTDADDPDTRRSIGTAENREQLFENDNAIKKSGIWETLGEQLATRRDGLISHSRWLINIEAEQPEFAVLLDHYPASAGKREAGMSIGSQIKADLIYYPSRVPLRAVIGAQERISSSDYILWSNAGTDLWKTYADHLKALPWAEQCPCLLGPGRILLDSNQKSWWKNAKNCQVLPLGTAKIHPLLLGCDLQSAFIIWNGEYADVLSVQTAKWGTLS